MFSLCRCAGLQDLYFLSVDAQVDYGFYRYRALYAQVAQENMYEFCSNVSLGSWPAILDDRLVRIIGDGVRFPSKDVIRIISFEPIRKQLKAKSLS